MRVEMRRYRSRTAWAVPRSIIGVAFIDPHQGVDEAEGDWQQCVKTSVMHAVRLCYHPDDTREFEVIHFSVGPPRGPRRYNAVAYIELTYGLIGTKNGWRCGFRVSYSEVNGFRLWGEIRNPIRKR
ncbi:MAG: hypothetical protein WBB68_04585 [Candidatus Moraniibacteriota bacterium]